MRLPFGIEISRQKKDAYAYGKSGEDFFNWADYKIGFDTYYQIWRNQSDVNNCCWEWSQNVGAGGIYFFVPDYEGKPKEGAVIQPAVEQELHKILNYKGISFRLRLQATVEHIGITGNAYWLIVRNLFGDIIGIQVIDPRTMHLVTDKFGNVLKYIQKYGIQEPIEFEPQEIIHFIIRRDSMHENFGFAPMEPILWDARSDLEAMFTVHFGFKNRALPSVQFVLDDKVNPKSEAGKALIESIKKNIAGSENSGRSGVFQGVKDIKTYNISWKDVELLPIRNFNRKAICARYGLSEFLFGFTESVNNNNGVELLQDAYDSTYAPMEITLGETITSGLLNRIGLQGKVAAGFRTQLINQKTLEDRAQKEVDRGILTRRQYKVKTGQKITREDEKEPNFDMHVLAAGKSAILLSEVGVQNVAPEKKTE